MRIYKTRLAKTKYHTYIVRSNIENADVLFDGINVGQISNGVYYHKIKESEDTGTHTVQLQNGTLPVEKVHYGFIPKQSFTIDPNGGRIVFNKSNIESEKITTTYSSNDSIETLTTENNICTINARIYEIIDNLSFRPTYYDVPANETRGNKTYSVTLYQDESNERLTVIISQQAGTEHTYTVNSDIEGATVIAGSEIVGTINNGTCRFIKWNSKATDLSITLSGGTLVTKEDGYTFEVATPTKNVSADGGIFDVSTIVTSLVGSYIPKYPSAKICHPDSSITINTEYDYDTVDAPYTAVGQVTFTENETTNPISREITITQDDTGRQEKVTITQEAGVRHTYTIISDCNGAQVNIDGTNRGTISGGQFVYGVWNSKAPASVSVSLTGGLPSNPSTDYTFSVNPSSLAFGEDGGTKSLTITSRKTTHTYVNTNGTCQRDSSVTCNAKLNDATSNVNYSASESLSWITTSGASVTASANSNYNSRSGTITYTQAESGKTDIVNVTQEAKTEYTYTVNSNCNGGTVYFNNVRKGTISNGRLQFTDEASSGTVRISGGVPSNYTDYGDWYDGSTSYEYQTGSYTNFVSFDNRNNMEHDGDVHPFEAKTSLFYCYAYKYATRQRRPYWTTYRDYTTYNYSAPANKTCQGNGSVTMNYTQSTSSGTQNGGTEYGSWSYYDTVYDTLTLNKVGPTYSPSEASKGYTCTFTIGTAIGSDDKRRYPITVTTTENTEYAEASKCWCDFGYGSTYTRIVINKAAADIEYVFKTVGTLGAHTAEATSNYNNTSIMGGTIGLISYKRVGNTYTQLGVSFASGGKPSQVYDYWAWNGSTYGENKGANTGWTFNVSFKESTAITNWNDLGSANCNSYTVKIQQAESGKTISIPCMQRKFSMFVDNGGQKTKSISIPASGGNGGTPSYIHCGNGYSNREWALSWGGGSWGRFGNTGGITENGTGSSKAVYIKCDANKSFSSRSGSATGKPAGTNAPNGVTINVTQAAAPNVFYINGTKLTAGNYAISKGSVTSLNTTGTVPLIAVVGASKLKINAVLTTNNSNTVAAPFTAYTSQSFKLWKRAGSSGSWTLYKTFSVSPGGTVTA